MTNRQKPRTAEEDTRLVIEFEGHPDADDIERSLAAVLKAQNGSGKALGAKIIIGPVPTLRPMVKERRRLVGAYLIGLGTALLAVIPWAWSFASRVIEGKQTTASFLGLQFTPTPEFSMVLILLLTALLGSVVILTLTFSDRAGHETLERGYLWWYLTRPISAAGLGLLFYMAVFGGFFSAATATDRPALIVAAAIGGLAGLFTDQVLAKMGNVLGLLPTSKPASGKTP